jgi:hypothetical protein
MTSAQLCAALGDKPDTVVMRGLLHAEIAAVRAGAPREPRTMRNVWYNVVKPALSRAGILNKRTSGGNPVAWDKELSKRLGELVRDGLTTYEELMIVDGSRQRQAAVNITAPVANVRLTGAHFPWVILFTEKDTIWQVLQSLAELYGVSAISGGGEPSNACTENTVRAIVRSQAYRRAQPQAIVVLQLTDYDPAGYDIANAQVNQIIEAVNGMDHGERGALRTVTQVRLGLTPDALTPEERLANAYEPKDKGLAKWFERTGGVDGQPLGLELDALPLSRLRRMFAEGIEPYIDLGKRKEDLREAFLDILAYDLLGPDLERRRQAMRRAAKQSDAWRALLDTPIPDSLFTEAAVQGANSINPIEDVRLFAAYRQELAHIMGASD